MSKGRKGRLATFYENEYTSEKCAREKYSQNYGIRIKPAGKVL